MTKAARPARALPSPREFPIGREMRRLPPSRRHLQRQLQLCPRRRQPGAEPARRLSAAPRRQGPRLFADDEDARVRAEGRSGLDPGGADPRPRANISSACRLPPRARRDLKAFRPNIIHLSSPDITGHRALTLGAQMGFAGHLVRPHPLRDLSALLRHGLPGALGAGDPEAFLPPLRRHLRAVRFDGAAASRPDG